MNHPFLWSPKESNPYPQKLTIFVVYREPFHFPVDSLANSHLCSSLFVSSLNVISFQAFVSNISYQVDKLNVVFKRFLFKTCFSFEMNLINPCVIYCHQIEQDAIIKSLVFQSSITDLFAALISFPIILCCIFRRWPSSALKFREDFWNAASCHSKFFYHYSLN